ncbi:MAG: NAD-binding protein [Burkholderiales bacterium]
MRWVRAFTIFLSQTLFVAPVYVNYSPIIANKHADWVGFMLRLALKDMNLVLDTARAAQVPMPFANIVRDRLLSGVAKGRAEMDWTVMSYGAAEDAGLAV